MTTQPEIGDLAPDFEALTDTGETVRLRDFRGKRVVLYFYPKDNTPGCTRQAVGFRDHYDELTALNAVILGVSPDGQRSHQKFKAKHDLPFHLLVDEDHAIAEMYGVWGEKKSFGRTYMGVLRSHFVIDEDGRIVDRRVRVRPDDSVRLALQTLREMAGATASPDR